MNAPTRQEARGSLWTGQDGDKATEEHSWTDGRTVEGTVQQTRSIKCEFSSSARRLNESVFGLSPAAK